MSLDLTDLLRDWPHEPGMIKVRKILGTDGKEKIVGGINVSAIAVLVMAVVSVLLGAILALTKKADPSTSPAITPSSSCGEEKP